VIPAQKRGHVGVRLSPGLRAQLETRKQGLRKRTVAPVIESLLAHRLASGKPPVDFRPSPLSPEKASLFLPAAQVEVLRAWARAADVTIGDLIFTMLLEECGLDRATG